MGLSCVRKIVAKAQRQSLILRAAELSPTTLITPLVSHFGILAVFHGTDQTLIPSPLAAKAVRFVYACRTQYVRTFAPHLKEGNSGMLAWNVRRAGGACFLTASVVAAVRRHSRMYSGAILDGDQIIA